MQNSFSDDALMFEWGLEWDINWSEAPAGNALAEIAKLNELKAEIKQSEVDIQNLMNMCAMWSWA